MRSEKRGGKGKGGEGDQDQDQAKVDHVCVRCVVAELMTRAHNEEAAFRQKWIKPPSLFLLLLLSVSKAERVEKIGAALTKLSGQMPPHVQQQQQQQQQKLQVKIFCADGSTKAVVVDETLLAASLLDILVEKNHVQLQPTWAIVEHLPELYMERWVGYTIVLLGEAITLA